MTDLSLASYILTSKYKIVTKLYRKNATPPLKKEIDKIVFIFEPTGTYSSLLKHFCCENTLKHLVSILGKVLTFQKH